MGAWGSQETALKFREWARGVISSEIERQRPRIKYGRVTSINRSARKCTVQYTGESVDTTITMGVLQPGYVGQIVRVDGPPGDKYLTDVLGGGILTDDVSTAYWRYSGVTSMSSPSNSYFRTNNTSLSSVTSLAFMHQDASGNSASNLLHRAANGTSLSYLTLSKANDANTIAIFKITGVTDNSIWDQIACTHRFSMGSFTADDFVRVSLTLTNT